jgi:hypothetical protein
MVEKMTAFWLIILTIITCAAIPVLLVVLTAPQPTQFIIVSSENLIGNEPYKNEINFLFNLQLIRRENKIIFLTISFN